ncbi:DUF983 domain-containing protein [Rapidithrix thailandica]|uniref:DUF983 domain-containing protein n=1 Tax=Rapidithrix thailandica TaxID=413964 RepID=A0AAW9RXE3_9BACT
MKIVDILTGRCPNCQGDAIFPNKSLFSFRFKKMHDKCTKCGNHYSKEPGFFMGAMYVSYGIAVAECIIVYLLSSMLYEFEAFDINLLIIIGVMILLLFPFNFRMSRIIWIYMFS